jgi:hypothetical protein
MHFKEIKTTIEIEEKGDRATIDETVQYLQLRIKHHDTYKYALLYKIFKIGKDFLHVLLESHDDLNRSKMDFITLLDNLFTKISSSIKHLYIYKYDLPDLRGSKELTQFYYYYIWSSALYKLIHSSVSISDLNNYIIQNQIIQKFHKFIEHSHVLDYGPTNILVIMKEAKKQIEFLQRNIDVNIDPDFHDMIKVIDTEINSITDKQTYVFYGLLLSPDNQAQHNIVMDIKKMLQPDLVELFLPLSLYSEYTNAVNPTFEYTSIPILDKRIPSGVPNVTDAENTYNFLKRAVLNQYDSCCNDETSMFTFFFRVLYYNEIISRILNNNMNFAY